MVTETAKATVLARTEANEGSRMSSTGTEQPNWEETARDREGGQPLRQLVFNWVAKSKNAELKHFELVVTNTLLQH